MTRENVTRSFTSVMVLIFAFYFICTMFALVTNVSASDDIAALKARITALEKKVSRINDNASNSYPMLPTITAQPWVKISDDPALRPEGLAFDRQGNLFMCAVDTGEIFKITPNKKVKSFLKDPRMTNCAAIDIHKDGRLFFSTYHNGKIIAVNADGTGFTEILAEFAGKKAYPDDMIFDKAGNFYIACENGSPMDRTSVVYHVSSDLKVVTPVVENLLGANGISLVKGFGGDEKRLMVGLSTSNTLMRVDLQPDGIHPIHGTAGLGYVGYFDGACLDSQIADSANNIYQCIYSGGRIIVFETQNLLFEPIAQVIIPERKQGKHLLTLSVTIKPGTNTGYVTAGGAGGAWIYTFKALAPAMTPFSHR